MQRAFTAIALIVLGCAACATVDRASADARLVHAQNAFDEGHKLKEAGKYTEAIPLIEHALQLREAVFTGTHPKVADCLELLGELHRLLAEYARAEPLLTRALETREAALGGSHPSVATSLNSLALLYMDQGLHARAEPLMERALKISETAPGNHHLLVATSLHNLALLYSAQEIFEQAEPLYVRALKIREATLGEHHILVADLLNNLATLYESHGFYARAEPLYERALKILEASLGEHHPHIATLLSNLAGLYESQGRYARAEPLLTRALEIQEASLGEHHPQAANLLTILASVYDSQGFYSRAEALFARALEIYEAALGEDHPDVANALNNLATLYESQGFYARAEPLYARAIKIHEASSGNEHPDIATPLNNLASLYLTQGLYMRAEPLLIRALKIREAALGSNHPDVAYLLNNLAGVYDSQGLYARAEPFFARALEIWESAFGENHPLTADALSNLGALYKDQGLYSRAEPLLMRALKIGEATLGENHPRLAYPLNSLASLYKEQGLYSRAESLLIRALKLREAAHGETHPEVAFLLHNLGLFHLAQQHLDTALPLLERAFTATEQHLRQELFGFSEQRLATFLHRLRAQEERLYALVRAHPDSARARHLALSASLLRKGRSVQEIGNTSRIIYRNLGNSDRQTFERLRALRTQLATLSLAGPGELSPADYQQRLKALAEEGDALEGDLARRSEPLRRLHTLPSPSELIPRVSAALPRDSALVEFIAYQDHPFVHKPGLPSSHIDSHLRYLALLLFADGTTRAIDLGPAEPIDRAALRLHHALAHRSISYLPAAQGLYTLTLRPLMPHLGKVKRLFLSPDGQLNLVPFAALYDGRRFAVDSFHITYLTSGKDLLPRAESLASSGSLVIVADPDFGSPLSSPLPAAQLAPALTQRSAGLENFFSTMRSAGADIPWTPLPGTRYEAEAIHRLFPHAQLLLGPDASKQTLLKLSTPGLLHIATHGFFLEDASPSPTSRAIGTFGAVNAGPEARPADPLLRSGLVLAGIPPYKELPGAHQFEASLVTALELAGLNLWGTQLVVLSACDTGRGDVKVGDGVYGLRRAFLVAGAETVVTSLWKVNDDVTRQLMERYYRYLLAGLGRTSALREAMRELRREQPHPHFWAAFTALGSDAPLQELTPPPQPPQ